MTSLAALEAAYREAVHAADAAALGGEPEAQLTVPLSNLFNGIVALNKLGTTQLIRETRLDRTRPDFAVLLHRNGKRYQKGYIELKAPATSVDVRTWVGRNAAQWQHLKSEAEVLIICNGREAQLYQNGEAVTLPASLPYEKGSWNADPFTKLVEVFLDLHPSPVTSVADLSKRLAIRTADLRDRLLWLLKQSGLAADAARGGYASWTQHVHPDASEKDFADGAAQVIAYGMVLATLSAKPDSDVDGQITVAEARNSLRGFSPVLAAAFAPLIDKPALFDALQVELAALEALISAIDPAKVNKSADRRGEPWLYFYEDFLSVYDSEERRQAGVYYTPIDVVQAMVNIVDHLLVFKFGKRLGFADPSVTILDPATGTGTFPLAVIDAAANRAENVRGKAGRSQAAANLAKNLFAFELLPGPYSVAHLRLSQRLKELTLNTDLSARVILTDTLESPLEPKEQLSLFGDAEVLAAEQNRAKRVKLEQRVTVVLGNPPYRRVERDTDGRGSGGWVVDGRVPGRKNLRSLFDDLLDIAKKHTVFSHHASLYNLYVYFWRWAIWKAFEAHGDGPGIVAFITASSWLSGPGFMGLRKMVREICDECWVIDLGGDNKGADVEENIFAIETPVAIVILMRSDKKDKLRSAQVHYRKIHGGASEKLKALSEIAKSDDPLGGTWSEVPVGWMDALLPLTGDHLWHDMPLLKDIFPWQQPGCKFGRTWPIAPSEDLLRQRWERFVEAPLEDRPSLFVTAKAGRNINTRVGDHRRLADVVRGEPSRPIVRYGFRSFDRQWAFNDPRMAKTESPSLWSSWSDRQIYLSSLMTGRLGAGPSMTASAYVPDLHFFHGRGGKDIIPLYRDAQATAPNITKGLANILAAQLDLAIVPPAEDIAAYVYAVLSAREYQALFAKALRTPGPRVPITKVKSVWQEAVSLGRELLWLHTFAERLNGASSKHLHGMPLGQELGWDKAVTILPQDTRAIVFDPTAGTLTVGDGLLVGVSKEVWDYNVSGMPVLRKWLSYRTAKGAGKAASSKSALDKIRPRAWQDEWNDELLDLIRVLTLTIDKEPAQDSLVRRIVAGDLVSTGLLPTPKAAERKPPRAGALI